MTQNINPLTQRYILLDSCILEYFLNEYMNDVLTKQIDLWRTNKFEMSISDITYAQLIDGAHINKENKVIGFLDRIYSFPITRRIMKGAGKLGSVYKEAFQLEKGIALADKAIAATSIIFSAPIIIANIKDFPQPFFNVLLSKNIVYKQNDREKMIYIAFLYPNYEYIKHAFSIRK